MLDVLVDSLLRAAQLSLLAVGLTLVYSLLRFPNFAHVEFAVVGAYIALLMVAVTGMPILPAAVVALLLTGCVGWLVDRVIFLRLRSTTPILMMIASFGLGLALRETVRAIAGSSARTYPTGLQTPYEVFGVFITPIQITILVVAAVMMLMFYLLLKLTQLGVAMRATADNPRLAEASGIYTERIIGVVWFIGAALAGLAGVLIALDTQLHPQLGFGIIIPVFCAAIMGGIGNPYGAALGALVIGFAENLGLFIDWSPLAAPLGYDGGALHIPTGYRDAIPFVLLIAVLLLRPQGILGERTD